MATANERTAGRKSQQALDRRALKTMTRIIHHLYNPNDVARIARVGAAKVIKWREVIDVVRHPVSRD